MCPNQSHIYLCVKQHYYQSYKCMKFEDYSQADSYYKKNYKNNEISTLMPVCKYVPVMFHKYILEYKLSKLLIQVKIRN